MTNQPNCPRCKHEKFAVVRHTLYSYKDPNDGQNYYRQIDLLCCDDCGAVICQYDPNALPEPKLI
jgi:hypothetical protein